MQTRRKKHVCSKLLNIQSQQEKHVLCSKLVNILRTTKQNCNEQIIDVVQGVEPHVTAAFP